jgi:succinate dehydrogenase/fumarate reductase flavoprotein subunit
VPRVVGALCLDIATGELAAFAAGAIVIATGGYQELYPLSSASSDLTGDGYALALDAGAELVDMEILLYYPTVLLGPPSLKGTMMLYEFFLRRSGAGAHLVNLEGEDLLESYDSLPVRDELSRRILVEVERGKGTPRGGVFLDLNRSEVPLPQRREAVKQVASYARLAAVGLDVATNRFEVAPGAHTVLGGIRINSRGETNVSGLYAAGEAAGNVHGANRLAGNALTDTQTFGYRAGRNAADFARANGVPGISDEQVAEAARPIKEILQPKNRSTDASDIKQAIQRIMLRYVGPTRSEEGVTNALGIISNMLSDDIPRVASPAVPMVFNYALVEALEVCFMANTALAVCHAARLRRESRGHHFRSDYPSADERRAPQHTLVVLQENSLVGKLYDVT